jgi:hypothetical protein
MATKEEKIENAICFFALEHEKFTHAPLPLSSLHRYLASLGYRTSEKKRHPVLNLLSGKLGKRHIVLDVDGKQTRLKGDRFSLTPYHDTYVVKAMGSPELDCFSPFELLGMKRAVEIGAAGMTRRVDGGLDIREAERRRVWVGEYATIASPPTEKKDAPRLSGLNVLIQRYAKQLEELQVRIAKIKERLEIATEAARLLEEEGLSDDMRQTPLTEAQATRN